MLGDDGMATKSFLKSIYIKDKKSAKSFVSALENAETKGKKEVNFRKNVKEIEDEDTIRKMFFSK